MPIGLGDRTVSIFALIDTIVGMTGAIRPWHIAVLLIVGLLCLLTVAAVVGVVMLVARRRR